MAAQADPASSAGSRALIVLLVAAAAVLAVLPEVLGRTGRARAMGAELQEVLGTCRDRYAAARTPDDTLRADAWVPGLRGADRPGDPPCGAYRRRSMLK